MELKSIEAVATFAELIPLNRYIRSFHLAQAAGDKCVEYT